MATILTKKKDTTGAPSAGDLTNSTGGAELAVNTADKRLYTKDSGGNVVEVGINPTSITTGTLNTSGAVVFNDAGADVDFRVEGDTNANLLFVDASTDRVGIGTNAPASQLEVSGTSAGNALSIIRARNTGTTTGTAAGITLSTNTSSGFTASSSIQSLALDALGNSALIFNTPSAGSAGERMRIDSSGNLLVGTTSAGDGRLRISASANAFNILKIDDTGSTGGNYIQFLNSAGAQAGSINHNGTTSVNYGSGSDYRLKENVAPMTGALAKVLELNPVTYTWKADGSAGEGFIAHELQELCPDAVVGEKDATEIQRVEVSAAVPATYDDEGNELTPAVEAVYEEREVPKYQTVDTSFLVATLTSAIQELKAELDEAKTRIAALENA